MKLVSMIVLGVTIALHGAQATSDPSKSDAELSRQLVGTWPNPAPVGIITFYPDHTFRGFIIPKTAKLRRHESKSRDPGA
jgi:hypothetical protein